MDAERTDRTEVSPATQRAEEEEARAAHRPDRSPTAEEEREADDVPVDPEVARHYEEMSELGAEVEGEGRIS